LFSPPIEPPAAFSYNATMPDIIVGVNAVSEALKAGRSISRILVEQAPGGRLNVIIDAARAKQVPVERVDRARLEAVAHGQAHQGVIAYAATRTYASLGDLLKIPRDRGETALFVILDGIEDPHNLGAVMRTVEAVGGHGVVVRSIRAVGLTPAAIKAAAGAAEYVAVAQVVNIARAMEDLKKSGVWLVGIDMTGPDDYTAVDYTAPTAIVVGGEGKGLGQLVRQRCDMLAHIPMRGKITSLNASVAAGVVLYEALRQRAGVELGRPSRRPRPSQAL
jgi:23S rRNA (guanosine2251-2'-O)-methyltransferase